MAVPQTRLIAALIKKLQPAIRDAFIEAMSRASGGVDQQALIAALEARDLERAMIALRLNQAMLFPLEEAIRAGFVAGGLSIAPALPKAIASNFGFDGRSPRADEWMKTEGAKLIQSIQEDTLDMTRIVIRAGIENGTPPASVARSITGKMVQGKRQGGFLGLTAQQTDSVIRGRAKLLSGEAAQMQEYLKLKLRDHRYDQTIRRAIADETRLSATTVDNIIEAHKVKALKYRGEMIAKNEAFSAQAAGRGEGYKQVLERADVETVTVRWQHNLSEKPREDHVEMSGTVIELGETFDFPDARMEHPHDPAGGAKHSIGCRCVAIYRVVVLKE